MKTIPRTHICSACKRETYKKYEKCLTCGTEGTVISKEHFDLGLKKVSGNVQLSLNDYQTISGRTANRHDYELANYGLGITGEAGEVADLIKKSMFHGHEVDKSEIKKELGDVLWYLANIATLAGLTLEEIATANVDKLMKRYPNGFDKEASVNRVDTK